MALPSQHPGAIFHHTISSSSSSVSPSLIPLKQLHIPIHRLVTRIAATNPTLHYHYTRPFSSLSLSTAVDAPVLTSAIGSPPAVPSPSGTSAPGIFSFPTSLHAWLQFPPPGYFCQQFRPFWLLGKL